MPFIYGRNLLLGSADLGEFEVDFSANGTKSVVSEPLAKLGEAIHIQVDSGDVYMVVKPKVSITIDVRQTYTFSCFCKTNVSGSYEELIISAQPTESNQDQFEIIALFDDENLSDIWLYDLKLEFGQSKTGWTVPPESMLIINNYTALTSLSAPMLTTWVLEERTRIIPFQRNTRQDMLVEAQNSYIERAGVNGIEIYQAEFQYINDMPTGVYRNPQTISQTPPVNELYVQGTMVVEWRPDTRTESVPFTRITTNNNQLLPANSYISRPGVNGSKTYAFDVKYVNGERTNETRYERVVSEIPVINELYIRGTMTEVWTNETRTETQPFGYETVENPNLDPRNSGVTTQGKNGVTVYSYQRKFVNGIATNETRNQVITSQTNPINEIFTLGTKEIDSVTLQNRVVNGNFESGTSSWLMQGGTFSVNSSNQLQYKANSRYNNVYNNVYMNVEKDRKYYIKLRVKSPTQVHLAVNQTSVNVKHTGNNQWQDLTYIYTAPSAATRLSVGLIEMSTNLQTHIIDYAIVIDLSFGFGLRSEPSIEVVDKLLKHAGYFTIKEFSLLPKIANLLKTVPYRVTGSYINNWYYQWETIPDPNKLYYLTSGKAGDVYPVGTSGSRGLTALTHPGYYLGSEMRETYANAGLMVGVSNTTNNDTPIEYVLIVEEV